MNVTRSQGRLDVRLFPLLPLEVLVLDMSVQIGYTLPFSVAADLIDGRGPDWGSK
jgi:hypothetical protein